METKKYYTTEEINSMSEEELRQLASSQQAEAQVLRWRIKEVQELLITALQSLPKKNEL